MAQTFSFEEASKPSSFDVALQAEGVTGKLAAVARSIYTQESGGGKNTKTSNAGAVGGMQIIPSTFASVADKGWDINDQEHNARAGIRYLKQLDQQSGGDPALTAAGYYGGPGGLEKARKGVAVSDPRNPNAPNTLQYGQEVAARIPKGSVAQVLDNVTDAIIPSAGAQTMPAGKAGSASATFSFEEASAPAQGGTPTAPKRSMIEELGRQLGLTVRAGVNGVAAIPAMAADAVTAPINAGLQAVQGKGQGFRFKSAGKSVNDLMTSAGLPQPENATERVVQDAAGAVAGAGGMVRGGQALANYAGSSVAQGVGKMLAAEPALQLASAATGAGASGITREAGGGAGAQLAAGLAGAMLPSVAPYARDAGIRGLIRGGEQGRQRVEDTINAFDKAANTTPTVGQATGSHVLQAAETGLTNTIGSSGVMVRRGEIQARALDDSVRKLSAALAPGASGAEAGGAITSGVNAFRDNMKTTQQRLYAQLDRHIPADTAVSVNRTQQALQSLNEGIDGAPSISKFFQNSKIGSIERALLADLDTASTAGIPAGLSSAGMAKTQGQLPYQAVQKLRSMIGREIADNSLVADVPRSKWRALYSALSDDMGGAAQQAGPQAQQAWERANRYTRLGMERINQLESIVNRDTPEKVFKAATTGLADGGTTIKRVMSSLPIENRREVSAAVLQRLGRAKNGMQNDVADVFSSETFLTNLAAMSPAAKQALFGASGFPGLRERVDQMARMASVQRDGAKVFANPSGTARQAGMGAWVAALASGLATGNVSMIAGALGAPAVANIAARKMTSPDFVRGLAQQTEMNPALAPAMLNAAAQAAPIQRNSAGQSPAEPVPAPAGNPQTFSFEDAQQTASPAQPEVAAPDDAQGTAEADPSQAFISEPRADGMLILKGDPQALHDTLIAAGIPARSIVRNNAGVMVGRSQAGPVREAIARMQQPEPAGASPVGMPAEPLGMIAENWQTPMAVAEQSAPGQAVSLMGGGEQAAVTPDGRIEPAMASAAPAATPDVHPTVSTADAMVAELATAAGVPLEMVLPSNMSPVQAQPAQAATDSAAPAAPDTDQAVALALAEASSRPRTEKEARARRAQLQGAAAPEFSQAAAPRTEKEARARHAQFQENQAVAQSAPAQAAIENEALQAVAPAGMPAEPASMQAEAPSQPGSEALPGVGVEPAQHPELAHIKRLHDAGETQVAGMLQRAHDREQMLGATQSELAGMREAAPDLPHHQNADFQKAYQQQRLAGTKPAEAAARAGILVAVHAMGSAGIPETAVVSLLDELENMPLDEAPDFVQRFTQALIAKGVLQDFKGADQIGQVLEYARDGSMHAMVQATYS